MYVDKLDQVLTYIYLKMNKNKKKITMNAFVSNESKRLLLNKNLFGIIVLKVMQRKNSHKIGINAFLIALNGLLNSIQKKKKMSVP